KPISVAGRVPAKRKRVTSNGPYRKCRQQFQNFRGFTRLGTSDRGLSFPGNLIPANRIDPTGQAYLKLLPAPNGYVNPAPGQQYTANYLASATPSYNRRNTMLRFDSNITDKLSMFYRYGQDVDNDEFEFPVSPGVGTNVRFTPGYVHGVHLTYIASPTLVNEFAFGVGHDNYGFYHTTPDSQWFRTDTLNRPRSARFPRVRSMKTICRAPLIAVALWPARRIFIPAASKLRDRAAISPHTRISMTTICSRTT
ncbi:MAG TPA: hypothetical protein VK604_05160, partial [Bryobacteraceae bacterium]|nr:hypothetical protein [Bryobacteraceae bacterium]